MGITVSEQLVDLENDIKALKASTPIYASNIESYLSVSQEFPLVIGENRIQFTPTQGVGSTSFVELFPQIKENDTLMPFLMSTTEPQDGSGKIVLKIYATRLNPGDTSAFTARVYAIGTVPGYFTML